MLNITESKHFAFSIVVGDQTFNLSIASPSKQEAINKLIHGLQGCIDELNKALKTGAN